MGSREKTNEDASCRVFWNILVFVVFICSALCIISILLPHWRVSPPIKYSYLYRNDRYSSEYRDVSYGLYTISFDGGAKVVSWDARIAENNNRGKIASSIGNYDLSSSTAKFWASMCPPTCQKAITARTGSYKKIRFISTLLLITISISCALIILALGWYIILGKNVFLMMLLFSITGISILGTSLYWAWDTNDSWLLITLTQQFPYPQLGLCWYFAVICGSVTFVCGIMCLVLDTIEIYLNRRAKTLKIDDPNIVQDQANMVPYMNLAQGRGMIGKMYNRGPMTPPPLPPHLVGVQRVPQMNEYYPGRVDPSFGPQPINTPQYRQNVETPYPSKYSSNPFSGYNNFRGN